MSGPDDAIQTQVSSLALLDCELVLVQKQAMSADELARIARDMGLSVDVAGLESLHRTGIMVPIFGVDQSVAAARRGARRLSTSLAHHFESLGGGDRYRDVRVLLAARDDGDVLDPAAAPYAPWSRRARLKAASVPRTAYLYAWWQLLGLQPVLGLCPGGDPALLERRARHSDGWGAMLEIARREGARFRRLCLLLAAVEPAYLPELEGRLVGFFRPGEWQTYRRAFDPGPVLRRLGWSHDGLERQAEMLLSAARGFDPLANWADLVGLALPSRRSELKGLARLAVEFRTAAELLYQCHEELVASGTASARANPRKEWLYPISDRLEAQRSLDRVLTRYGLSPHPSVLVVVEGKTERSFIRRYLNHFFDWDWTVVIQILDAEGVDQDVTAAAAVFAPRPGGVYSDSVLLDRPLTRILVITDPEGHHATAARRESAKRNWRERIRRALPGDLQSAVLEEDLDALIEFEVPDAAFEYGQFSDVEIADAIGTVSKSPSVPGPDELTQLVRQTRKVGKGLTTVWEGWLPPKPNKLRIVESLFPSLVDRVDKALARSRPDEPPIAKSIGRLLQMAAEYPRDGGMALRLKPGRTNEPSG